MSSLPSEDVRSIRLPVSGDVIQWRVDGAARLVPAARYVASGPGPAEDDDAWNLLSPDEPEVGGIAGEQHPASTRGGRDWWRWFGDVPDEGEVVARYADGTEAAVIIAGPVWCVEGYAEDELVTIEVAGAVFEPKIARALSDTLTSPRRRQSADLASTGWWGGWPGNPLTQPSKSKAQDHEHRSPGSQPGVAFVTWDEYSDERQRFPREPWPIDSYSCTLQFADGRLGEVGPNLPTLDEALAWARARTAAVIVRPQWDPSHQYRATNVEPKNWSRLR